jgi:hypothetical protein
MTPDGGNGGGDLDPETVAELRRLPRSRPRSGREAVAKASALRTLERSRRVKRRVPPMTVAGIRMRPATRSTSLIGCSCMSTPRSCGAIGRRRGARAECECPGCYSRSPTAFRAS